MSVCKGKGCLRVISDERDLCDFHWQKRNGGPFELVSAFRAGDSAILQYPIVGVDKNGGVWGFNETGWIMVERPSDAD